MSCCCGRQGFGARQRGTWLESSSFLHTVHVVPRCRAPNPCLPQQQDTIPYVVKKPQSCAPEDGQTFARNMLSWSWRSIKLLLLHLVGFYITLPNLCCFNNTHSAILFPASLSTLIIFLFHMTLHNWFEWISATGNHLISEIISAWFMSSDIKFYCCVLVFNYFELSTLIYVIVSTQMQWQNAMWLRRTCRLCVLRCRSAALSFLVLWVRTPIKVWALVSCVECCVSSGLCEELTPCSEKSYRLCLCLNFKKESP